MIARLVRIRWDGFGRTRHWLVGTAHTDYVLREAYMGEIVDSLYGRRSLV